MCEIFSSGTNPPKGSKQKKQINKQNKPAFMFSYNSNLGLHFLKCVTIPWLRYDWWLIQVIVDTFNDDKMRYLSFRKGRKRRKHLPRIRLFDKNLTDRYRCITISNEEPILCACFIWYLQADCRVRIAIVYNHRFFTINVIVNEFVNEFG